MPLMSLLKKGCFPYESGVKVGRNAPILCFFEGFIP